MIVADSNVAAVVCRFDEAWRRGDVDALMMLVSDDCVYDASIGNGPGTTFVGRAEVRRGFLEMLAYDESDSLPGQLVMVDDSHSLVLWTARHAVADNTHVVIRGCDVFEVQNGLIRRKDAFRKSFR